MTADTVILVPTVDEAGTIDQLLRSLLRDTDADVLVIDDGSTDGTGERLAVWAACHPGRVCVMRRGRRMGLGTALVTGYRYALEQGYERVVQMDADLSHDPAAVPALLDALANADLVIGSRYVAGGRTAGWPRHRQLLSTLATGLARRLSGVPVRDITSGFRAFRRGTLETLNPDALLAQGYSIQVETTALAHRAGLRVREVPITFHERRSGVSKMTLRVLLEWGRSVWRVRASRTNRPPASAPRATRFKL